LKPLRYLMKGCIEIILKFMCISSSNYYACVIGKQYWSSIVYYSIW